MSNTRAHNEPSRRYHGKGLGGSPFRGLVRTCEIFIQGSIPALFNNLNCQSSGEENHGSHCWGEEDECPPRPRISQIQINVTVSPPSMFQSNPS